MQFMKSGLPDIDDLLLDRLISGLEDVEGTPGLFRPVTLNMAGIVLYRDAGALGQAPERLIHRYISDAIDTPEIADYSRPILSHMITHGGSKRRHVSTKDLATGTKLSPSTIRQCLNRLSATSLVIPLDSESRYWEVSHDFLAELIASTIGSSRASLWPHVQRWFAPGLLSISLVVLLFTAALRPIALSRVDYAKARLSDLGCLSEVYQSFSLGGTPDCRTKLPPDTVQLKHLVHYIETVIDGSSLVSLDLSSFVFDDITPLERLSLLEELSIRISQGSSLESVAEMNRLRMLSLRDSEVRDLSPLARLMNLDMLDLRDSHVTDLSGIDSLSDLESLDLSGTKVTDIAPLSSLQLSHLSLQFTELVDFGPLSSLASLRSLDLSYTNIVDIAPIIHLEELATLLIYCTDADTSELASLPNIEDVFLDDDSDASSLRSTSVNVHRVTVRCES